MEELPHRKVDLHEPTKKKTLLAQEELYVECMLANLILMQILYAQSFVVCLQLFVIALTSPLCASGAVVIETLLVPR